MGKDVRNNTFDRRRQMKRQNAFSAEFVGLHLFRSSNLIHGIYSTLMIYLSTNPPTCTHCTQCIHETCQNLQGHHWDIQRAFLLFCICKKVDEYVIQTLYLYLSKPWHDPIRAETAFVILSQTPLVCQCIQVPLYDIWKCQSSTIFAG